MPVSEPDEQEPDHTPVRHDPVQQPKYELPHGAPVVDGRDGEILDDTDDHAPTDGPVHRATGSGSAEQSAHPASLRSGSRIVAHTPLGRLACTCNVAFGPYNVPRRARTL